MTRGLLAGENPTSRRFAIRALLSGGFRRYAGVQFLSSVSVSAQMVAELWLVWQITGEGLSLGTSTAIRTAPALVLAGVAGSLADRFPRKGLLTFTQAARGALIAVFAVVAAGDLPAISTVYLLVLGLGCVQGIDQPMRRAILRDVVTKAELPSAASLHTATISTGGIVGPLIAGLFMTQVSPVGAFAFAAAAAAGAVMFVRSLRMLSERETEGDEAEIDEAVEAGIEANAPDAPVAAPAGAEGDRAEVDEDVGAGTDLEDHDAPVAAPAGAERPAARARIWAPELRPTFLLLATFSVLAINLNVLLPLIAEGVLGGGAGTFSVLFTCLRVGTLGGSLVAAVQAGRSGEHHRIVTALVLCGLGLGALAGGTQLVLALLAVVVTGVFFGWFLSMASARVHIGAQRAVQGRQLALYSMIFIGGRSVGAPLTGWAADRLGTRGATALLGAATLLGALAVWAALLHRHRDDSSPGDHQ